MNVGWNLVNAGLAVFGLLSAHPGQVAGLSLADSLTAQFNFEKILLLNAGLDVAYIATGSWLRARAASADRRPERLLVAGVAILPIVANFTMTVAGEDVLGTRYTSIAAPFLLVVIGVAVASLPRIAGAGLAAAALVVALIGTVAPHRPEGFYLDARAVMAHVVPRLEPGDVVLMPPQPGSNIPLTYYARRRQAVGLPLVTSTDSATVQRVIGERRRLWIIAEAKPTSRAEARRAFARIGYRPLELRGFPGTTPLSVALAAPLRARPGGR